PCMHQGIFDFLFIDREFISRKLIRFRENKANGDRRLTRPLDQLGIDLLQRMPCVDQDKQARQGLTREQILRNHLAPALLQILAYGSIPITGQIDQVPLVIDKKMIDGLCLTGPGRSLRQTLVFCEHVDQGRLANIRATDECKFRLFRGRTLADLGVAGNENSLSDFHLEGVKLIKVKIEPENTKNVRFGKFKHFKCAAKSSVFSILAPIVLFFDIILLLNYFSQCTVSLEY